MTKCERCKTKIKKHLWVVNERAFCSPLCERGKDSRFADKMVRKLGVAGFRTPSTKY